MNKSDYILQQIESYIAQISLPSEPDRLYAPIRYTLAEGGKRLRPMLLALTHQIFSDKLSHALPAAAAVEIFHNFTLLHDDIMDNPEIRRGKPTVHKAWNENVAILSGDVMMIYAYRELAKCEDKYLPQLLNIFNTFAKEVCEGQQYDMDYETQDKVAVAEYMNMIELKTSVLIGGATLIGATIGGADEQQCKALYRFGVELGLAFQLQDDLLDTYGDESLGKAIGGDILEGKQTFLKVTAISKTKGEKRGLLTSIHLDRSLSDGEKIEAVKEIYNEVGVKRIAEQMIVTKMERALSILDSLDLDSERVEPLRSYAMNLLNRVK